MSSGWAAVSRKANWGAHAVCPTPVGPANSPTRDLVLLSVHSTGHAGHLDRVLYVLHMLAQVGAPDGDTGASVYRPSQRLHLFQDMGCSPPPTSQPLAAQTGRPSLPPSGPLDPQHPRYPSKGSGEEGAHHVSTHRVDEGCGALHGHSFSLATSLLGHATWTLSLAPHTAILGPGSLAAAAVPVPHRAVVQYHWGQQRQM